MRSKENLPVDVADIEDFAVLVVGGAGNLGIASLELDGDGSLTEVGAHGEICDGSDQSDCSGDVVEDTVVAGPGEGQANDDEGCDGHDGSDRLEELAKRDMVKGMVAYPVPIRTTDGDTNGGGLPIDAMGRWMSVDVERIVGHVVGQSVSRTDTVGVDVQSSR